jgi:hypothetical protein
MEFDLELLEILVVVDEDSFFLVVDIVLQILERLIV